MVAVPSEQNQDVTRALKDSLSQAALNQVRFICVDNPSGQYFHACKELMPNLECMVCGIDTIAQRSLVIVGCVDLRSFPCDR